MQCGWIYIFLYTDGIPSVSFVSLTCIGPKPCIFLRKKMTNYYPRLLCVLHYIVSSCQRTPLFFSSLFRMQPYVLFSGLRNWVCYAHFVLFPLVAYKVTHYHWALLSVSVYCLCFDYMWKLLESYPDGYLHSYGNCFWRIPSPYLMGMWKFYAPIFGLSSVSPKWSSTLFSAPHLPSYGE